jgi:hypothetical protein
MGNGRRQRRLVTGYSRRGLGAVGDLADKPLTRVPAAEHPTGTVKEHDNSEIAVLAFDLTMLIRTSPVGPPGIVHASMSAGSLATGPAWAPESTRRASSTES